MEDTQNPLSDFEADVSAPAEDKPQGPTWEEIQSQNSSLQQQLDNAQRTIGEQGRQLGEYRSLISERHDTRTSDSQVDLSDDDFITSPKAASEKLVNTRTEKLEQEIQDLRREYAAADFERRHPDARELLTNQEFVNWANQPSYLYLAQETAQGNLQAAESLFNLWESQNSKSEGTDKSDQDASALVTERSNAASNQAPAASNKKPISRAKYREAMMRGDRLPPEVMQEIQEAYFSGNVE